MAWASTVPLCLHLRLPNNTPPTSVAKATFRHPCSVRRVNRCRHRPATCFTVPTPWTAFHKHTISTTLPNHHIPKSTHHNRHRGLLHGQHRQLGIKEEGQRRCGPNLLLASCCLKILRNKLFDCTKARITNTWHHA